MANYDEIVTQVNEHRNFLLENAEQQRLVQSLATPRAPSQPHPMKAWVGRQLVAWGQQLQGEESLPPAAVATMTTSS